MANVKKQTQDQKDAIKFLKKVVKIDSELLVSIHSVSSSGMSRKMSLYVIGKVDCWKTGKDGKSVKSRKSDLIKLNWYLQQAGFEKLKDGQIVVGGCGMDMAFSLTYNIKCALYGHNKGGANQQYRVI